MSSAQKTPIPATHSFLPRDLTAVGPVWFSVSAMTGPPLGRHVSSVPPGALPSLPGATPSMPTSVSTSRPTRLQFYLPQSPQRLVQVCQEVNEWKRKRQSGREVGKGAEKDTDSEKGHSNSTVLFAGFCVTLLHDKWNKHWRRNSETQSERICRTEQCPKPDLSVTRLLTFAIRLAVSLQNWVGLSKCWIKWGSKQRMLRGKPIGREKEQTRTNFIVQYLGSWRHV